MECKCVFYFFYLLIAFELIDTLWNVNKSRIFIVLFVYFELIDTLWNVNEILRELEEMVDNRINRYIMECKFCC